MPDISTCRDHECPSRLTCWQSMATSSAYRQGYLVAPRKAGEERCYAYWEMEKRDE